MPRQQSRQGYDVLSASERPYFDRAYTLIVDHFPNLVYELYRLDWPC
jgi:hypothetical protein